MIAVPAFAEVETVRPLFQRAHALVSKQTLEGIKTITGLSALPEEGRFLALSENPAALHEFSLTDGKAEKLRAIRLEGFKKLSAAAYISPEGPGYNVALTEEARGSMAVCKIEPGSGEISRGGCKVFPVARLHMFQKKLGLTALAVDTRGGKADFYLGKEGMPKRFYHASWAGEWRPEEVWDAEGMMPVSSFISDASFYKGSLYVLDGRAGNIYQMDPLSGQTVSVFSIRSDARNSPSPSPKPRSQSKN